MALGGADPARGAPGQPVRAGAEGKRATTARRNQRRGSNASAPSRYDTTSSASGACGTGGYGRQPNFIGPDAGAPLVWEPEFSLGKLYNK